jgi:hypothetical protein
VTVLEYLLVGFGAGVAIALAGVALLWYLDNKRKGIR